MRLAIDAITQAEGSRTAAPAVATPDPAHTSPAEAKLESHKRPHLSAMLRDVLIHHDCAGWLSTKPSTAGGRRA